MNEKLRVLKADIEAEEAQIARLYDHLSRFSPPPRDPEQIIIAGYYMHNLYTAFEHLSTLVATAFENQISDRNQWHSLLLKRMTQDIEGIRPRLFSEATARCLNELRGFRHVFRSAYASPLDPDRFALVFKSALDLKSLYPGDLERFKGFIGSL